jgi:hypothetical protein
LKRDFAISAQPPCRQAFAPRVSSSDVSRPSLGISSSLRPPRLAEFLAIALGGQLLPETIAGLLP